MDAFRLGGWGMYPTLVFGLVFIGFAIAYARRPLVPRTRAVRTLGALTFIVGSLGFVTGVINTMKAAEADPKLVIVGVGESLHNVSLALVMIVLGTIAAVVGHVRAQRGNS